MFRKLYAFIFLLKRGKNICVLPVLQHWTDQIRKLLHPFDPYSNYQKNTPLTYIDENNKLFINQTVNVSAFDGLISYCQFAPVIRSIVKKDHYILGNLNI